MKKVIDQCRFFYIIVIILALTSCKKFVEVGTPPDRITQENVFSNDRSATAVLTDLSDLMSRLGAEMAEYCGLLADEWSLGPENVTLSSTTLPYYTNTFESNQSRSTGEEIWNSYYNYIFRCNAALEGLKDNRNLSPFVKNQLLGEAYFMRAYFYFYLTNIYGNLPLAINTNPEITRLLARSPIEQVYQLIIDDLLKAQDLLSPDYINGQLMVYPSGAAERVRPTKWAAIALLARAYLYVGQWANAESKASQLIENTSLFNLSTLSDIFLKNSSETIFQAQPTDAGWNTREARRFHLTAAPAGLSREKRVYLSQFIVSSFEPGDKRLGQWIDSLVDGSGTYHFPTKYKVGEENPLVNDASTLTEYSMILRLSEQFLIRAEARANQNNLSGAIDDLDLIRGRAEVPLISSISPGISQEGLLNAILHERQVELFSEWGHRWFDLKRFDKVDEVMNIVTPQKGGAWEAADKLLPIPYGDMLRNPKLIQNPGY